MLGGAERAALEKEVGRRLMDDGTAAGVSDEDLALLSTCETLESARLKLLVSVVVRARRKLARPTARRHCCHAQVPRQPPRLPTALPTDTI